MVTKMRDSLSHHGLFLTAFVANREEYLDLVVAVDAEASDFLAVFFLFAITFFLGILLWEGEIGASSSNTPTDASAFIGNEMFSM